MKMWIFVGLFCSLQMTYRALLAGFQLLLANKQKAIPLIWLKWGDSVTCLGFGRWRKGGANKKKNEENWNKQGHRSRAKCRKEAKINWMWKIRTSGYQTAEDPVISRILGTFTGDGWLSQGHPPLYGVASWAPCELGRQNLPLLLLASLHEVEQPLPAWPRYVNRSIIFPKEEEENKRKKEKGKRKRKGGKEGRKRDGGKGRGKEEGVGRERVRGKGDDMFLLSLSSDSRTGLTQVS